MSVMGDVLPYRPPNAREEATAWLGMVIFLASWAMLFAALFFAYGFVRTHSGAWPPADVPVLPVGWAAFNTVLVALSSAALQGGVIRIRQGLKASALIGAAWLLGVGFLASQVALWRALHAAGLTASSGGTYGSVFYGLTGFHGLHVVVGLLGLAAVWTQARRGSLTAARHLSLRLWAMYWHFVGVIWGLLFVSVFAI